MNRPILIGYQLLIGLSDTLTGALLMIAPELTLRLMHLSASRRAASTSPSSEHLSSLSGLSCLYGASSRIAAECRQQA